MSQPEPPEHPSGQIHVGGSVTSGGGDIVIGHGNVVKKTITQSDRALIDYAAVKHELETLYEELSVLALSSDQKRATQRVTDQAIEAISDQDPQAEAVVERLQAVGQTMAQAGVTVQQGTRLAATIGNLAKTLGPLVIGGAKIIGAWFGLALPF